MDARARQKEKQRLFTELYKLDNIDTNDAEDSPMKVFTQRPTAERLVLTAKALKPRSAGAIKHFLRNNDIAPARRAVIRKTLERGALWVKEWRDDVTHVIVDKDLCYNDVISFLKIPSLPPGIILVNQTYIFECIDCRFVANPRQPQYQVEGYKTVEIAEEPVNVDSSERSLSLKPDKSAFALEAETPSRTEGSEQQESLRQALKDDEARALEEQCQISRNAEMKETRNALDDAIAEVTTLKDLPMDPDEDEDQGFERGETADDPDDSHSEDERKTKKPKLKKASTDQQNFNCMHKHDGLDKSQNPNHRTIEVLQQMANHYETAKPENHEWKVPAYRRAISALRKLNFKVMTKDQAIAIPFIGTRLAAKIEEIVWTDRLRRLDNIALEPRDIALQLFLKIYGVGIAQASTWVTQGHRTIHDLSQHAQLTKAQETGIAHYTDFLTRIPRAETDTHARIVRDVLAKAAPGLQLTVGGSYRRGAPDSGDIDFIVTKPPGDNSDASSLATIMVGTVIPLLFGCKYLRAGLATATKDDGSKWHGAACLPHSKVWRRVDFLLVPWEEMGAALIYFTGNDIFNRSIRLLASKKGMRLNQRGLWRDVLRGKGRQRITQGSLVEARSERRIFEVLGVPYRPPEHRIC
ncbi:MAG: hypothetical protein Q9195_002973 [Heterodermia aff. obscurata]